LALPGTAPAAPPSAQPAAPASTAAPAAATPKIDTADLVKRANAATGFDIEATIKSWQKALDRLDEALRRPNLRYNDLNLYRDELLKLRSDTEDFWSKLEPPLTLIEDQVQKLPPAPAQGQPP